MAYYVQKSAVSLNGRLYEVGDEVPGLNPEEHQHLIDAGIVAEGQPEVNTAADTTPVEHPALEEQPQENLTPAPETTQEPAAPEQVPAPEDLAGGGAPSEQEVQDTLNSVEGNEQPPQVSVT